MGLGLGFRVACPPELEEGFGGSGGQGGGGLAGGGGRSNVGVPPTGQVWTSGGQRQGGGV